MKAVFRTDASIEIGSGHVMRCLTLAGALKADGAEPVFVCRELSGNLCAFIESRGFKVRRLPPPAGKISGTGLYAGWLGVDVETDARETAAIFQKEGKADWLVVDHYALDKGWQGRMRPLVKGIMVIDDLADREHDCDILLDQNLYEGMEGRYDGKVSAHCKKLLGPSYALLRPEFIEAKKGMHKRDGRIRRILVFYGGADPTDETSKALRALHSMNMPKIAVDVVVGDANPNKEAVEKFCFAMPNATFRCQTGDMAKLMAGADIALGGAGTSSWERCSMGLPSIVTVMADNQAGIAENLAKSGIAVNLGRYPGVKEADIEEGIRRLIDDPATLKTMAAASERLVDGMGARRVVDAMTHGG